MSARFYLTQTGLNVINRLASSTTGQVSFSITKFKLASSSGYTPALNANDLATQQDLLGTVVYEGIPSGYAMYDELTLDTTCVIPSGAGPFVFGELGLYCLDRYGEEILLGLFVFPAAQTKTTQTTDGIESEWTFHALLKLGAATQIIFSSLNNANSLIPAVPDFSYVTGPNNMPNTPNALIVYEELCTNGSQLIIATGTQPKWNVVDWYQMAVLTNTAGSNDVTLPTNTIWGSIAKVDDSWIKTTTAITHSYLKTLDNTVDYGYLLQDENGNLVPISSVDTATGTATLARPAAWIPNSKWLAIYEFDARAIGAAVSALDTALTEERLARISGDNDLGSRLDQEIIDRTNADTDLSDRLDQEIIDRAAEDDALSLALQQEITNLSQAVTALGQSVNASLSQHAQVQATDTVLGHVKIGAGLAANSGVVSIADKSNGFGTRYVSTSAPSGGNDGDIWYQV